MQQRKRAMVGVPGGFAGPVRFTIAGLAGYALAVGLTTLVGWFAGIHRLTDWEGRGVTMFANTALAATLAGAAVLLGLAGRARAAAVPAGLVAVLGGATLLQHLFLVDLGLDTLLVQDVSNNPVAMAPGRMGPPASVAFLLIGTALLFIAAGGPRQRIAASALGAVVVALALLSLIGYAYGAEMMYHLPRLTAIALQSATVVLALGLALVASVPERGPMRTFLAPGAAGAIARRMLPLVLIVPVALGWLRLGGEAAHIYGPAFGSALRTLIEVLLLGLALWWATRKIATHERGVRASEDRVRSVLENALDAAYRRDLRTDTYDYLSPVMEQVMGISSAQLRSMSVADVVARIHPDDVAAVNDAVAQGAKTGKARVEYRLRTDEGRYRWLADHFTVSHDEAGTPLLRTGVVRDMTEQKRAQAALRQSEDQHRSVLENMSEGLMLFDATGNLIYQNPASLRIHGFDPMDPGQIGREKLPATWAAWDESGRAIAFDEWPVSRVFRGERFQDQVLRVARAETEHEFYGSYNGSPIYGADGTIILAFITIRDITAQVHAQREMQRADERLRRNHETFYHLIQNNPFGIFLVDADQTLVQVSFGARKMFENVGPVLGRDFAEVLRAVWPEPFASEAIAQFRATLATGESYATPNIVEPRRGTTAFEAYDWRIERISLPDGRFGVVCYSYDLSERQRWTATLAETKRKLDAALIAGEVGTFEWQIARQQVGGDANFARMFGVTLDEHGTAPLADYIAVMHPDDQERVRQRIALTVETGVDYEVEYRVVSGSRIRWLLVRARPERDEAGQVVRASGVCLDVTDLKRAEEALRESEERFRAAVDQFPSLYVLYDAERRFTFINAAGVRITGRPASDFVGRRDEDVWPEDVCTRFVPHLLRTYETKQPQTFEMAMTEANGSSSVQIVTYVPLLNASGEIRQVLGVTHDITERKRAEQALRDNEQRLQQMAEAMPQIVWVTRPDGFHEYYNRRWYDYTGVPLGSTDGEGWNGVFHPEDQERAWDTWQHCLQTGDAYEIDYRLRRHDGDYRWFLGRALPVKDARGQIEKWFGTCTDIHEAKLAREELQKAKETAEAANRAKDQLLAAVSHELRTPLNPIMAIATYLLGKADLPADLRDDIATIRRNVEQEARIVDDLLNLTRLQRDKIEVHQEVVDVHALLQAVIGQFAGAAERRGILLTGSLRADPQHAWADPGRIQQVFSNLLDNALKFTPDGGRVIVRTHREADGQLCVEVADTGIGIDPAVLPKLFTPFEQGGAAVTRRYGGLGLGLAIIKGIVELHGGSITATSDGPGHGTTFRVHLKAVPSPTAAPPPPPPSPPSPPAATEARACQRILLVEDHADTLKIMSRVLGSLGYTVFTASSASEAMKTIDEEQFDLLVSDLGLPDGSGLDIMRTLRARGPTQGIALSGFGDEADLRRSREAGFADHLVKPVSFKRLDTAIKRLTC